MLPFTLTILGSSSASPTSKRNPTAQLLKYNENLFLVDCGEGTQVALRKAKANLHKLKYIFISHLHGDHYFGLIGLLSTLHLLGRKQELHVFGPPELKQIIDLQLHASATTLVYSLVFHPTQAEFPETILETKWLQVTSFPLVHRIPTTGFLFTEKPGLRRINKEATTLLNLSPKAFQLLQNGDDCLDSDGNLHKNPDLTYDPHPVRSYAFVSDTAFTESIVPVIQNVNLLYHETTFLHELVAVAKEKFHSTTLEAASIAKKANAKKLIIGHFSARYEDVMPLLKEAQSVFENTFLAEDFTIFDID